MVQEEISSKESTDGRRTTHNRQRLTTAFGSDELNTHDLTGQCKTCIVVFFIHNPGILTKLRKNSK